MSIIATIEQLEAIYGQPNEASSNTIWWRAIIQTSDDA